MTEAAVRDEFRSLVALPEEALPLFAAAFCLARVEAPELPPDACEAELDDMAGRVRARLSLPDGRAERRIAPAAAALRGVLHDEAGLRGHAADYYDPANSDLHQVLRRKLGIPISLSVLYLEVARRAGLEATGIGFPGHFLVQLRRGNARALLDPFHGGREVTTPMLVALLRGRYGAEARLHPEHLEPVPKRLILVRMLNNLKGIHARRQDPARALRTVEMILDIQPDNPAERRDRGLLLMQLEQDAEALAELSWYAERTPSPDDAPAVLAALEELRLRLARWN